MRGQGWGKIRKNLKFETCDMRQQTYYFCLLHSVRLLLRFIWTLKTLNIFSKKCGKKIQTLYLPLKLFDSLLWFHAIFYTVSGVQTDVELKIVKSVGLIIQNIQLSAVSIIRLGLEIWPLDIK